MSIAYLGLGSNLGNREQNIQKAIHLLKESGAAVLKCSTIIETDPAGGPPQDKYLNAVLKIETKLSPQKLLNCCQGIEAQLKRVRAVINGPRTMDIDILLYDHIIMETPGLTIPHPRMLDRDFVMIPLKEIEPEIMEGLTHAIYKKR